MASLDLARNISRIPNTHPKQDSRVLPVGIVPQKQTVIDSDPHAIDLWENAHEASALHDYILTHNKAN